MPVLSTPPQETRYLNIKDTAIRLGCSVQWVSMMILEGRLPAINISLFPDETNAHYRIPEDAVIAPNDAWKTTEPVLQARVDAQQPPRPLLRVKAVASRLSCSQEHVARLIVAGKLTAFNLASPRGGGRSCYRIPIPAVERYIASCQAE